MRVAVLSSPESWYFRDLLRAAAEHNKKIEGQKKGGQKNAYQLEALAFRDLACWVGGQTPPSIHTGGADAATFDAVLVRSMPPGSLEQVIFRMDVLGAFESGGGIVMNPPRAMEIAIDKYLALLRLQAAGLPTPRTFVCQSVEAAMQAWRSLGNDAVLKPIFGGEGNGITRLTDEALAHRAFKMLTQNGAVLYLQEFIDHLGYDIRILLIGEKAFAMRRRHPTDWRTNLSRGATAEACPLDDELLQLARRAGAAIGAPIAGVDILPSRDGRRLLLEVNAVPGWKGLSRVLNIDIAAEVLAHLQQCVDRRAPLEFML